MLELDHGTSYEIIRTITKDEIITRIAKGKQSGELWDRVILADGIVGYVFQSYLKEYIEKPKVEITDIKLSIEKTTINKNEKIKLNIEILPEEAKNEKVIISSSNEAVALVDDVGNILGVSSGITKITVKAENNISSSIEIKVYSPVTEISLDVQNINLQIGENFKINPVIYPEDASNKNVNYISLDENIAKVDKQGNIQAIKEGKTTIKAITEDNNKEASITINVTPKLEDLDIKIDESIKVNGTELSGIDYKNNTVKYIKEKIKTSNNIEVYRNNELLSDDKLVGSGNVIKIIDSKNTTVLEFTVILYGDVNGDGKINSVDLLVLQRHILEIEKLKGALLKAGNISKNGKNPSSLDSLLIQRHILGLKIIEQ